MSRSARFNMLCLIGMLLAGACGSREHLGDDYGRRTRVFFAKQHVYAEAASGSPAGLDSEESAVVQDNYRRALSGGQQQSTDKDAPSRVLLLRDTNNAKPPM